MREFRTYGSVRGALSNERPYRDIGRGNQQPLEERRRWPDKFEDREVAAALASEVSKSAFVRAQVP